MLLFFDSEGVQKIDKRAVGFIDGKKTTSVICISNSLYGITG
jgi:hypothetical protein